MSEARSRIPAARDRHFDDVAESEEHLTRQHRDVATAQVPTRQQSVNSHSLPPGVSSYSRDRPEIPDLISVPAPAPAWDGTGHSSRPNRSIGSRRSGIDQVARTRERTRRPHNVTSWIPLWSLSGSRSPHIKLGPSRKWGSQIPTQSDDGREYAQAGTHSATSVGPSPTLGYGHRSGRRRVVGGCCSAKRSITAAETR